MVATPQTLERIGMGLYTPTEAATYARISPSAVHRWLYGASTSAPAVRAQITDAPEKIVTFFDFVQLLAIRNARRDGVSLQKIRTGIQRARESYGVDFPLAHRHQLVVFDRDLHIVFPEREEMRDLTGTPGQGVILRIAEPFMTRLDFGADGMADRYTPFQQIASGTPVRMDPDQHFGEPIVGDTGYPADVLYQAYRAEGSVERAARAYEVREADILTAIEFHDELFKIAA